MMQSKLNNINQYIATAKSFMENNDFQNAAGVCSYINNHFPKSAIGWYYSSCLALKVKVPNFALSTIEKAISLDRNNSSYILHKILCLQAQGKHKIALALAHKLEQNDLYDTNILIDLAMFYSSCNHTQKACDIYYKAVKINPTSSLLFYNLACVERFLGKLKDAQKNCDIAIELDNLNADAHFLRSSLSKKTTSASMNHIAQLQQLTNSDFDSPVDFAKIQFALAKELEDCSSFDASFKARKIGAETYRNYIRYDLQSEIDFLNAIQKTFDLSTIKKFSSNNGAGENIIFILGLPRTGSTLVDRILSSHSDVKSAGELTTFTQVLVKMIDQLTSNIKLSRPQMVSLSRNLDFAELGQQYINNTCDFSSNSKIFIDKFPQNSIYAGIIHLALPKAKIVLTERNPLDCCYAIYKQLFTDIYQFSYDLEELAGYYIAHQRLMSHWVKVIPDTIHIVQYEGLIENIEQVSKDLLEFCNLNWQSSCLEFHKNSQTTATASASQVRQKIYSSSVGMWKNYNKQLKPLIKKLKNSSLKVIL